MTNLEWSLLAGLSFGLSILLLLFTGGTSVQNRARLRNLSSLVGQYGQTVSEELSNPDLSLYDSKSLGRIERWIAEKFFSANFRGQPNLWLTAALGAAFALFLVLLLLGFPPLLAILLAPVASMFSLWGYIEFRAQALRSEFQTELAEGLIILASSLRAGLNFGQALESLSAQSPGELGRQFRRALVEVQLGSEMEPALTRVSQRTRSGDLEWLVLALDVQREVGGPLAKILDGVAGTIKARASIRLEANSLAAEGKLSSYVLIALPIGILLFLLVVQPEYVAPLFNTPIGIVMMSIMGILMISGWFWLKKITAIRL